jgi:glycerophosphoryl diester phosphodiesterase
MNRRVTLLPAVLGGLAAMGALLPTAASANQRPPTLAGRAVLPAETLATGTRSGPPSGAGLVTPPAASAVINGIEFPRPTQPVLGFSAVIAGDRPGTYLAMPDNGYGNKLNSRDFLLRAYRITPDFKTAKGGSGGVQVGNFIEFRDPNHKLTFPIVNDGTNERLLTGADLDPESLQRGHNGDLWMGEEFGPWILHFNGRGVLLDEPFALPGGLMSPSNPFLGTGAATQPGSRGIEAMAISPDGKRLWATLEGATVADGTTSLRRRVFEFSTTSKSFTGREWNLKTESAPNMIADAWALDGHRMVVIERDAGRGVTAVFRNVDVVDLNKVAADGYVQKQPAVDLTNIADPNLISLPELHPGDVGIGDPFKVVCESIEAVQVLSASRLLLACDNNLPNTGRNPNRADDTEIIVVDVPGLKSH